MSSTVIPHPPVSPSLCLEKQTACQQIKRLIIQKNASPFSIVSNLPLQNNNDLLQKSNKHIQCVVFLPFGQPESLRFRNSMAPDDRGAKAGLSEAAILFSFFFPS
jgi:hypothetical protein